VPDGSEILRINGEPVAQIVARLKSLTSADGFNPSFRTAKVGQQFSVKYALAYGYPEVFRVTYQAPGEEGSMEEMLLPVSKTEIDQATPAHNELSLKELNDGRAALLTINTFAYYSQVDMFRTFLDSVFQVIDEKQIGNLVLDLRGNGGGDPFCASYLWAYLQPEPLPYFEDHYGRYDTLANPVPQPARHFKGNLYTLIDGLGFSTTGHFVGLLKYHGVGKFVGTESGATFTCTGNATYPALDRTRIMVGTARVMRYTAAVKDMDPRRGVIPDYPVELSQQDMVSGRDAVLEHALQLAGSD
jgi:C-terminal processing protease CtpA/Prc